MRLFHDFLPVWLRTLRGGRVGGGLWQVGAVMHVLQFFSRNECTFDKTHTRSHLSVSPGASRIPAGHMSCPSARTPLHSPPTLHAGFFYQLPLRAGQTPGTKIYMKSFHKYVCVLPVRVCACRCHSMGVSMVA